MKQHPHIQPINQERETLPLTPQPKREVKHSNRALAHLLEEARDFVEQKRDLEREQMLARLRNPAMFD